MTTSPTWASADPGTHDLLAAVASPHPIVGADAAEIFLAACRRDAMEHDGEVSVCRVRALLADADIPPHRFSSLWSHCTGEGRPMRKDGWETCEGSTSRNNGKPYPTRRWVES